MTAPWLGPRGLAMPANQNINLERAACRPWTGTHESKHLHETDEQFQVRYTVAKAICASCPAVDDCLAMVKQYRAHRVPLDGIFAGHHLHYRGSDQT